MSKIIHSIFFVICCSIGLTQSALASELVLPMEKCTPTQQTSFESKPCYYSDDLIFSSSSSEDIEQGLIRRYGNEPWAKTNRLPEVGLALSGGGSKMAPFAMGVLKRFADTKWLDKTDLLSSVSGGGYAAYFLYSNAWAMKSMPETMAEFRTQSDEATGNKKIARITDVFADVRIEDYGDYGSPLFRKGVYTPDVMQPDFNRYGMLIRVDDKNENCDKFPLNTTRHQSFVECYQDVLSNTRGGTSTNTDSPPYAAYFGGTVATILALPVHHIANSLFDWKIQASPTQHMYSEGVGRTYGTIPNPAETYPLIGQVRNELSFDQLQTLYKNADTCLDENCVHVPWWIINTTNAVSEGQDDIRKTVFEITPNSFGSGNYGYTTGTSISTLDSRMTILGATAASAAFFDSLSKDPPMGLPRDVVFLGLHTFDLRWGIDVPNFRVNNATRSLHDLLPWPSYYVHHFTRNEDSTHIRLADGGQSGNNLGIYPLLRRATRHIVIADGAYDLDKNRHSGLDEMCVAANLLWKYGLDMQFEGYPGDISNDSPVLLKDLCNQDGRGLKGAVRDKFSPYHWKRPVWTGQIVSTSAVAVHSPTSILIGIRLYYLKSAVDSTKVIDAINHWESDSSTCMGKTDHTLTSYGFTCGMVGYRIDSGKTRNDPDKWDWPQTLTVKDSADSSNNRFEAYRDLGWYLSGQLACVKNSPFANDQECARVSGKESL